MITKSFFFATTIAEEIEKWLCAGSCLVERRHIAGSISSIDLVAVDKGKYLGGGGGL